MEQLRFGRRAQRTKGHPLRRQAQPLQLQRRGPADVQPILAGVRIQQQGTTTFEIRQDVIRRRAGAPGASRAAATCRVTARSTW